MLEKLTDLACEWKVLTEQATAIRERKREMREALEPHVANVIPKLNAEFAAMGLLWSFGEKPTAGYTVDGLLSVELNPIHGGRRFSRGLVDYRRADELTDLVIGTVAIREFLSEFPHVHLRVRHNYGGNDKPMPSIKKQLEAIQKKRAEISA